MSVVNPENLAHRCDHREIPRHRSVVAVRVESFRFKAGTTIGGPAFLEARSACHRRSETRAAGAKLRVQANYNTSIREGWIVNSRRHDRGGPATDPACMDCLCEYNSPRTIEPRTPLEID